MYAIVEIQGKQYKVSEGDVVQVEKIGKEVGEKVELNNILMISGEEKIEVGNPYVQKAKVMGEIVEQGKGKKIIVFKYKRRKGYKRKQGHRQQLSKVKIEKIII